MRDSNTHRWPLKRFEEIAKVVTGSTPSTSRQEFYGGPIPFVTPRELDSSELVQTAASTLSRSGGDVSRLVPKDSVMVCCIGSLGKVGVAGTMLATNQQINTLVLNRKLAEPRFVFHYCRTLKPFLEHIAPSTTVAIVNKGRFQALKIPLPPLSEQQRIAGILDAADALRAKRRESLAQLDTLLQSTFLEMFGDPVSNPMGWEVVTLGGLGTLDRGVSKHRPRNAPSLLGGLHPLIQTGDVSNSGGYIRTFTSTYSDLGLKQSKMWPAGTLCITIAANIANTGLLTFDACFPDSVVGFLSEEEGRVEYVQGLFWFFRDILERKAPQVAQKNINLKILRNFLVPLPPLELQRRFAAIVESVEEQKTRQRAHLAELDALFASLQQRAFNGEL